MDYVIRLEKESKQNDSILALVAMNPTERETYFKTYIKALKQKDKEAEIIAKNKKGNNFSGFGNLGSDKNIKKGSKFYFYNQQTVSFGEEEFKKVWGNRPLEDNWRLSDKTFGNEEETAKKEADTKLEKDTKKYELAAYLDKIPNTQKEIDSIIQKRNKAYYNLGVLYKEQFKKPELAINRLEKLVSFNIQNSKLELPTYYHLYKAYQKLGDQAKSEFYKNHITGKFPDSKYAQLILNPDKADANNETDSPKNKYKETYQKYLDKEYNQVIKDCDYYIKTLEESPIIAKFELLKAQAIAKTKGKKEYLKSLNFIVNNYPNAEEARRAQEIINFLTGNTKKEEKKATNKTEKENIKRKGRLPSNEEMLKKIKERKSMGPPKLKNLNKK